MRTRLPAGNSGSNLLAVPRISADNWWPAGTLDDVSERPKRNPTLGAGGVQCSTLTSLTPIHDVASNTAPWRPAVGAPVADALRRLPMKAWNADAVARFVYCRFVVRRFLLLAGVRRPEPEAFLSLKVKQAEDPPDAPLTRLMVEHATSIGGAKRGKARFRSVEAGRHESALVVVVEATSRQIQGILERVSEAVRRPVSGR